MRLGEGNEAVNCRIKVELAFANSMQQLDAGDRHSRVIKDLEGEHGPEARLHTSMVLLDHIGMLFLRPIR